MGQEVLYCFKCQSRVVSSDFEKGAAFRIDDQVACAACTHDILPSFPLKRQREILNQGSRKETAPAPLTPRTPRRPVPAAAPRSSVPLAAAVVGGAAIVLAIGLLAIGGKKEPAPPPSAPAPAPAAPDRQTAARAALDLARSPSLRLDDQIRLLEKVAADHPGTDAGREARREADALIQRRSKAVADELAALLDQVRPLILADEYRKAVDLLQAARSRHPGWSAPIDERLKEIGETAARSFAPLKDKAVEARKAGNEAEARAARDQAARWGPEYALDLDKALLEAVPPVAAASNGTLHLRVAEATIVGKKAKRVGKDDWAILQTWKELGDHAEWSAVSRKAGEYDVLLNYACPNDGGGEVTLAAAGQSKTFRMEPTGGWGEYRTFTVGSMSFPAGLVRVSIKPSKIDRYLGSLRFIKLVPK